MRHVSVVGCFPALLATLAMAPFSVAAQASCDTGRSARSLIGPAPLTAKLRTAAAQAPDIFFRQGEFDAETFRYLGEVRRPSGKRWHVVFLETTWGTTCRSTPRLLVYSADLKYLGQYSHFGARSFRLEGDTIHLDDAEPSEGDKIQFSDQGPPREAHVDGENLTFYR